MSETFGLLKKLHGRPKESRRKLGVFIAGAITTIIFLAWILTLDSQFSSDTSIDNDGNIRVLTPFETVGQSLSGIIDTAQENFSEISF